MLTPERPAGPRSATFVRYSSSLSAGASSAGALGPSALEASVSEWTFLTNHGVVLLCLAADPGQRLRDVAASVGITERAVQRIVADLEAGGYLTRTRVGRRNQYKLHADL